MYSSWIFTILLLPQCFYFTRGISMETIDFKIFRAQMQLQDRMESLRKELKTEISFLRDHVVALLGKGTATTMPPPDIEKKIGHGQKEFRENMVDREQFVELANKCESVIKAFGKEKKINVKLRQEMSVLKDELNKEIINRKFDFDRNVTAMSDRLFNMMDVWKANTTKVIRNDMESSRNRTAASLLNMLENWKADKTKVIRNDIMSSGHRTADMLENWKANTTKAIEDDMEGFGNRTAASLLDMLEVWKAKTTKVIRNDVESSGNRTAASLLEMLENWKVNTTTKITNIMNTVKNRTKAVSMKVDESVKMIQEEQTAKFDNTTVTVRNMAVTQSFDNDLSPDMAYVLDKEYALCSRPELHVDSQEVRIGDLQDFVIVDCDQKTDGGGWSIIYDGDSDRFWTSKTWRDYQKGYEDVWNKWIGFVYLQALTSVKSRELRVEMRDYFGSEYWATFKDFKIVREGDSIITFFGEFNGTLWNDNCFKNAKLSQALITNSPEVKIWLPLTTCYLKYKDNYYYDYTYYNVEIDLDKTDFDGHVRMKIR